MNTKDHTVSRPGGMTVAEFKKRPQAHMLLRTSTVTRTSVAVLV